MRPVKRERTDDSAPKATAQREESVEVAQKCPACFEIVTEQTMRKPFTCQHEICVKCLPRCRNCPLCRKEGGPAFNRNVFEGTGERAARRSMLEIYVGVEGEIEHPGPDEPKPPRGTFVRTAIDPTENGSLVSVLALASGKNPFIGKVLDDGGQIIAKTFGPLLSPTHTLAFYEASVEDIVGIAYHDVSLNKGIRIIQKKDIEKYLSEMFED